MEAIAKVVVYLVHRGHLLVFIHPDAPEAGIQVPAGSVEPGEHPSTAARRELEEETGIKAATSNHSGRLGTTCLPMDATRSMSDPSSSQSRSRTSPSIDDGDISKRTTASATRTCSSCTGCRSIHPILHLNSQLAKARCSTKSNDQLRRIDEPRTTV